MSEMIERVAKAIDESCQPPGQKDYKILMENCARAAIEAMRELPEEPGPRYTAGEYSRRTQEAMIDDALGASNCPHGMSSRSMCSTCNGY